MSTFLRLAVLAVLAAGSLLLPGAALPARAGDPAPDPVQTLDLTVLSYNVHGVPFIDADMDRRMARIGLALAELAPDVVALQEVWRPSDADALATAGREAGLPHVVRLDAERAGSGLLVLSRFPVAASEFRPFPDNGDLWRALVGHVDRLAAKGAAIVRLETPLGPVALVDTHCVAAFRRERGAPDEMVTHRLSQVRVLVAALESAGAGGVPAILCGDLNALPGSAELKLLRARTGLRDTMGESGRRIDYVLVRDAPAAAFEVLSAGLALTRRVALEPGLTPIPLSDHPAVLARLRLRRQPAPQANGDSTPPR